MPRFSTWKNSILGLVGTVKYLPVLKQGSCYIGDETWRYHPGMKTHEAGWSGKECGGAGEGLARGVGGLSSAAGAPGCLL